MALLITLFFTASLSVARSLCPAGSVQGVGANDCYIYSLKPKFWFEADIDCKSKYGGALASVHGAIANAFIPNPVSGSCLTDYWLGTTNDMGGRWAWTDGSSFGYTHWASGNPRTQGVYCAYIKTNDSNWYSDSCLIWKPYICKVTPERSVPQPPTTTRNSTSREITRISPRLTTITRTTSTRTTSTTTTAPLPYCPPSNSVSVSACQCGSITCASGQVCYAPSSVCKTLSSCPSSNVLTSKDCICGASTVCSARQLCHSESGTCESVRTCPSEQQSSGKCICGAALCQSSNYCYPGVSVCSDLPPCPSGGTAPDECQCGTAQCHPGEQCNTGLNKCLEKCPENQAANDDCQCANSHCSSGEYCHSDQDLCADSCPFGYISDPCECGSILCHIGETCDDVTETCRRH